jgi:hypothetical protein
VIQLFTIMPLIWIAINSLDPNILIEQLLITYIIKLSLSQLGSLPLSPSLLTTIVAAIGTPLLKSPTLPTGDLLYVASYKRVNQ